MPDSYAFLRAFGIKRNRTVGSWKITKIEIEHVMVERYRLYSYPLKIYLTAEKNERLDLDEIPRLLKNTFGGTRTVNSRYGNPYECTIHKWELKKSRQDGTSVMAVVTAKGKGKRLFL